MTMLDRNMSDWSDEEKQYFEEVMTEELVKVIVDILNEPKEDWRFGDGKHTTTP